MGDEFNRFAQEVSRSLGAIQATQQNQEEHLASVSRKFDNRFDRLEMAFKAHIDDPEAHGEKAISLRAKKFMDAVKWLVFLGGAAAGAVAWLKSL